MWYLVHLIYYVKNNKTIRTVCLNSEELDTYSNSYIEYSGKNIPIVEIKKKSITEDQYLEFKDFINYEAFDKGDVFESLVMKRLKSYLKENLEPFSFEWLDFSSTEIQDIKTFGHIEEKIWKKYRIIASFNERSLNIVRYDKSLGNSKLDIIVSKFQPGSNLGIYSPTEICYLLNKIVLMLPKGFDITSKGIVFKR